MKIIGGRHSGRKLVMPKNTHTRPMSDKVREALFNIIGSVDGQSVLDAYSGSGAVGIEALSRGAKQVIAVDNARTATRVIKTNAEALGLGLNIRIMEKTVELVTLELSSATFDLIVADPPYDDIKTETIGKLGQLLASGGTLVVSHTSRIAAPELESMKRLDTRKYGDSSLSFYHKLN